MTISLRMAVVSLAFSILTSPTAGHAQFRAPGGGGAGDATGWAPVGVGVRVGFDNSQSEPMVGAMIRIPVLPSGRVELIPNGDVTFFDGLRIYQGNLEAVYLSEGRRGGLYAGGGVGIRDGVFGANANGPRTQHMTFSVVAGARFGGLGRVRPEVEVRWILEDEQARDPRVVGIGATVALW